ncbi:MAG: protein kinase [Planctomycetota bacterium]
MPDPDQIKRIFLSASELESPESLRDYLYRACEDDQVLRREVEELLNADKKTAGLLDRPAVELDFQLSETRGEDLFDQSGSTIGPYKLLEKIGEGGMGVVYMAEQRKPIQRRVAVKVVKPGMASQDVIARFEAERQALAMMEHPSIASVFDCGATEDGRPFFVMELVRGIPITEYCDRKKLTPSQRLGIFVGVCRAVQHAHHKGIIHRDLKPSNILVAEYDNEPVPKVIDFGIAKALNQQLTGKSLFTRFGQVLGTLEYMSPEQAKLNQLDVDTRSDVFSLGVILYELLSGTTPFDKQRLRSAAWDEILRIIREEDPPRPSYRLSTVGTAATVAEKRAIAPDALSSILRNELDWIIMKSMAKERSDRYDSASALARDLTRFISGDPVEARPPSLFYLVSRFLRKNRKAVVTASLCLAGLVCTALLVYWSSSRAQRQSTVDGLVGSLANADTNNVPGIIENLEGYEELARPRIAQMLDTSESGSTARLHSAMALLSSDASQVDFLTQELLSSEAEDFVTIRDFLAPYAKAQVENLWTTASDYQSEEDLRLRAVAALAKLDPANELWSDFNRASVAAHIVELPPLEVGIWRSALEPVAAHFREPFFEICREPDHSETNRVIAASMVAGWDTENSPELLELIFEVDEGPFRVLFDALCKRHRSELIALALSELEAVDEAVSDVQQRERAAMRKANAAIILMRFGFFDQLGGLPLPASVRNFVVHRYRSFGGGFESLLDAGIWKRNGNEPLKRALLLAIGEFASEITEESRQQAIAETLLPIYANESDPGIHSACNWLLKELDLSSELNEVVTTLRRNESDLESSEFAEADWYVNSQGQTFAIVNVCDFQMGSPDSEPGRANQETLHLRRMDRRLAAATTEITREQWRQFYEDNPDVSDLENTPTLLQVSHTDDSPMVVMTWYEAAAYCNWLSQVEGIEEDQWCYKPNGAGIYGPGMSVHEDFLERTGYRLPTEAEWEFLCRSGSSTAKFT